MKKDKLVIVINGNGGCGKDTLCEIAAAHYRTRNISSITPIVEIATSNGWWDGVKNDKSRRFLSDLKKAFISYNNLPMVYIMERYEEFINSEDSLMFVHIREPEQIREFTINVRGGGRCDCISLLVVNSSHVVSWRNSSDSDVTKYEYDYQFDNTCPSSIPFKEWNLEEIFIQFLDKILKERNIDFVKKN